MKLLRALHKNATRDAAIESLYGERLKTQEIVEIRRQPAGFGSLDGGRQGGAGGEDAA